MHSPVPLLSYVETYSLVLCSQMSSTNVPPSEWDEFSHAYPKEKKIRIRGSTYKQFPLRWIVLNPSPISTLENHPFATVRNYIFPIFAFEDTCYKYESFHIPAIKVFKPQFRLQNWAIVQFIAKTAQFLIAGSSKIPAWQLCMRRATSWSCLSSGEHTSNYFDDSGGGEVREGR
jgi:hypothetical protein